MRVQSSIVSAIGFSTRMCFPARGGDLGVFGMKLVRRRDIDRIDISLRAHRLDAVISGATEIGLEAHARRGTGIDGGHYLKPLVQRERRQHHGKTATEPGNAEFQFSGP